MPAKTIFRIILSLLILISLTQICSADVEVPFDYYYGRWVDGHQVGGWYEFRDDNDDLSKGVNYQFTQGKYQIGTNIVTRYDLGIRGYDSDYGWVTPNVNMQIRPNSHWQIGIDKAYYAESSKKIIPYDNRFFNSNDINNTGNISLSSHWINNSLVRLTSLQSRLSYYVTPLVSQGTLMINNHYYFSNFLERSFYIIERYDSTNVNLHTINNEYCAKNIDFSNSLQYGLNNYLNLKLNLNYHANCGDLDSYSLYYINNSNHYYINDRYTRELFGSYDLSIISLYTNPVYIHVSMEQLFLQRERTNKRLRYDIIDEVEIVEEDDYKHKFSVYSTEFFAHLHFLSTGEFDERILLDNYNNFYGTMLFHNQFYSGLKIGVVNSGFYSYDDRKVAYIDYSIAYGLFGNFELRADLSYSWHHFNALNFRGDEVSAEDLSSELIFQFRSYEYNPNTNIGWERDTKYDIVFGEIMKLGEVKMAISYKPPFYKNSLTKHRSFMSFDKLISNDHTKLDIVLSAGIGRGFVIELRDSEAYLDLKILRRDYYLEIHKRLFQKYKLSFKYEQHYSRDRSSNKSKLSDPTFKAEIQALF